MDTEIRMSQKMQAAVLHAPGQISVDSVEKPTISDKGQVLISVAACGVCGSDIDRMLNKGTYKMPLICGHEFSGYVVEVSDDVTSPSVGDLVTVPPLIPCFKCDLCKQGQFSLCEDYDYFGSRRNGAYAELVVSPASNVIVVPKSLDPRAAAMIDPCAIAIHALRRTSIKKGSKVAVIGAGPIGLFAIQWAKLLGASEILAVDLSEEKIKQAIIAGATLTATSEKDALLHSGNGYEVVFESAGVPSSINLTVSLVAARGDAVFVGIPNKAVEFSSENYARFLRQEINLHGAWNSFSNPWPGEEWFDSIKMLAEGKLKWEFMITHELALNDLPEMFQKLGKRSEHTSKVLFFPNGK